MRADLTGASDPALMTSVVGRDEAALAEVYDRHAGPVGALSRRLLRNRALADDVVQEVFTRLWNAPEKYDPARGSLRSYLLTQAHGRSVDLLRSETARKRREEADVRREPPSQPSVEDEVWQAALGDHVRAALARLDEKERRAIELAYFGGHSYRETARLLGEPEGTIKSRIRNGLQKLRALMADLGLQGA